MPWDTPTKRVIGFWYRGSLQSGIGGVFSDMPLEAGKILHVEDSDSRGIVLVLDEMREPYDPRYKYYNAEVLWKEEK